MILEELKTESRTTILYDFLILILIRTLEELYAALGSGDSRCAVTYSRSSRPYSPPLWKGVGLLQVQSSPAGEYGSW